MNAFKFLAAGAASALAASAAAQELAIEEIVVTATKRAESMQDIPMIAGVEAHAHPFEYAVAPLQDVVDEGVEKAGRDIVDAVEPEIFESVQSNALARPGESTDDDEAHGPIAGISRNEACRPRGHGDPSAFPCA
jgi:hypothetical protein